MSSHKRRLFAFLTLLLATGGCASDVEIVCEAYVECGLEDNVDECIEDVEEFQDNEICQDVIGYAVDDAKAQDCDGLRNVEAVWDEFPYCFP